MPNIQGWYSPAKKRLESLFPLPDHEPYVYSKCGKKSDGIRGCLPKIQAVCVNTDVRHTNAHHEHTRDKCDEVRFLALGQIDRNGEEGKDGEGLVEPGEITP